MAELKVKIPDELEKQLEESEIDVDRLVKEVITSKVFETQLSKSKAMQRALFEMLAKKSKLTKKGAEELSDKVNKGMVRELQKKFS